MTTNRVTTNRLERLARACAAAGALAMALACASCAKKEGAGGGAAAGGFQMPPTPVEVAIAAPQTVADRFEAIGTIEASEAVTIVAEIEGTLSSVPFREGAPISKGALIAQIDDRELAATATRAQAWRDQTKVSFDRVKSIVEKNAGSPQALDDARTALDMAEADLVFAQTRLSKSRIVAPFSGAAGIRRVSPGAYVRPGDVITDVVQTAELKVEFSAPERYIGRLVRGTPVSITTLAFADQVVAGTIDVVDATVDPATRSVRIIARTPNPEGRLRPGMSANVTATLGERANAITVPDEAVFAEGDKFFVFVVGPDSSVARAPLTLGTRLAGSVEVVAGLEAGARVVRAGHQKLFDGAKVMPIESQAGAPAGAAPEGAAPAAAGGTQ